ncbi:MAG: aminotransferase class I/II-fold pyridoxal phosphate-dependent enzyme [Lachnospiraceae bacterium]|nr:aminotransferase class I/II-fold pyridoxal phosphate-dependent enzyme [Lachnospiraceae bacterium]
MIPLAVPNLTGNEKSYLDNCIDTTFVSSVGEYVTRMEKMCKEACGTDYAVATSSGTTALHAMLMAAGVSPDDLVILPTFTFIASANAIAHCGATPWLFDINDDWVLDAQAVETALQMECTVTSEGKVTHTATGRRVAAIMPVYTLGNIPDMNRLRKIADQYRLPLIADAACAIGATFEGKLLGTLADASALSFNGNKTITCGGGGMVVGNDEKLMNHIRHITTTARVGTEYEFDMVGYNYRMTNVQAAIGCAQMERLDSFIERKRDVYRFYLQKLGDIENISFFPVTEGGTCWYSGIVLKHGGLDKVREICAALKEQGIESKTFWKPVHLQKPYREAPCQDVTCAEGIWDCIVTLPCSTGITDDELRTVVDCVKDILIHGSSNCITH